MNDMNYFNCYISWVFKLIAKCFSGYWKTPDMNHEMIKKCIKILQRTKKILFLQKWLDQKIYFTDNNVEPLCNLYDCNTAFFLQFMIAIQMKMSRPNGQFILHNNGTTAIKSVVDNFVECIHANRTVERLSIVVVSSCGTKRNR